MYEVKNDISKNRLYIRIDGFFTIEEAKEASAMVLKKASELKTGFDVVNDISGLKPGAEEVQHEIMKAQKGIMQQGAKRVVRVTGNVLGKMQFNRIQKQAGVDYEIIEVGSVADANKYLDQH